MIAPSMGADARARKGRCDAGRIDIDVEAAVLHIERLSYPRRAGSPRERRAARYILRAFSECGLARRLERFPVPYAAREIDARLAFAASAVAVLLGARMAGSFPIVAAACWVAAGILVNLPWRSGLGTGSLWPTRLRSQNLVATQPEPAFNVAPARVVFLAHYDTKSQPLPTGVRVVVVVVATACCGLLTALGLASAAGFTATAGGQAAPALMGLVIALLAVLAANLTGNRSPGALDNATGVATLLELASTWRPRAEAPVDAVWVATGAEEVGLDGARDFLRRHEDWLREKPTLLINLDTVGAGERVYLAGEAEALRLAGETADALEIPWSRLRVLGARMDHEPFADRGLSAVSVLGDVVGTSLTLHSARDVPALVDPQALARAGRLAAHLAWAWAGRHAPSGEDLDPASAVTDYPTPAAGGPRGSGLRGGRRAEGYAERV